MAQTYTELSLNEVRALEITIRDQDGNEYEIDQAYTEVKDEDGETVVAEQAAQVMNHRVSTLIGTATTASPGIYYVVWKLVSSTYTYYHVTKLLVSKLL